MKTKVINCKIKKIEKYITLIVFHINDVSLKPVCKYILAIMKIKPISESMISDSRNVCPI